MANKEFFEKLTQATVDLEDAKLFDLLKQGLKDGVPPADMINEGLGAGLRILGDKFNAGEAFLSDLMVAGEIMTEAVDLLRPAMEKGAKKGGGDVMVLGAVEGDLHTIGKSIVKATFIGGGFDVIDIGVNCSADQFVKAVKEHKATLVGASAILSATKPYCKNVNDALVEAGLRDKVFFLCGGWDMTQEWSEMVGADAFGLTAIDGLRKTEALKSGEIKKLKDRKKTK